MTLFSSIRIFRKLHRSVAPILLLPLLLSALTGVAYRITKSVFNLPDDVTLLILQLHDGSFLGGERFKSAYLLLTALGLVGLAVTGLLMHRRANQVRSAKPKLHFRDLHWSLTPILFLPLLITAITGLGYPFGEKLLGITHEQAHLFVAVHAGTYLGSFGGLIYVLLIGLGLVTLALTGITMTSIFRKRRASAENSDTLN